MDKSSSVHPVGFRKIWCKLIAKCILKVTVPETTHAYNNKLFYAVLESVIDGEVNRVQSILDANSNKEN